MTEMLTKELKATDVKVLDVSGGCGSAFDVTVASPMFEGKNKVQQARMVYKILNSEIEQM
eukprot:CAMPEP_0203759938 /NCGR_PEP_ID=MMETSP0098-20131031/13265_1 /ASSEMBLY_ACC=CAM_ASM_000208 /TAXON_ID=96639 /ORGANISM=" , Strain NY0313808BC1" /LENGTH=59 /DNA_ID=CAMNT_0050653263 /DNA_START=169 /DNA_END=345 /DNA_ORIENTATION=+